MKVQRLSRKGVHYKSIMVVEMVDISHEMKI